jgi:DNA-binding transcriptional ArsR family regulator
MNKLKQARSPRALYDLELIEGTVVAVVELKRVEGVMASHWWVSGLTEGGNASLLLQLQTGLTSLDEKGALEECQQMKPIILKLARKSAIAGGLKSALTLPEALDRTAFALAHLRLLDEASLLGDRQAELSVRTSRQYELCKSFGITTAVQLISDFEQVPISTIRRRLSKARDLGLIIKTRKSRVGSNGNRA